jgi:hypothetical protein
MSLEIRGGFSTATFWRSEDRVRPAARARHSAQDFGFEVVEERRRIWTHVRRQGRRLQGFSIEIVRTARPATQRARAEHTTVVVRLRLDLRLDLGLELDHVLDRGRLGLGLQRVFNRHWLRHRCEGFFRHEMVGRNADDTDCRNNGVVRNVAVNLHRQQLAEQLRKAARMIASQVKQKASQPVPAFAIIAMGDRSINNAKLEVACNLAHGTDRAARPSVRLEIGLPVAEFRQLEAGRGHWHARISLG